MENFINWTIYAPLVGVAGLIVAGLVYLGAVSVSRLILIYNSMIDTRNRMRQGFSQIDVQLQRRHDLIAHHQHVGGGQVRVQDAGPAEQALTVWIQSLVGFIDNQHLDIVQALVNPIWQAVYRIL